MICEPIPLTPTAALLATLVAIALVTCLHVLAVLLKALLNHELWQEIRRGHD